MSQDNAVNFADFPVVVDERLPLDTAYMMPTDIYELIRQAEDGVLSWEYVINEAVHAAKEGRIGIIKNIG